MAGAPLPGELTAPRSGAASRSRVAFFGTPAFAIPTLRALISAPAVDVVAVVCQPDRPADRGQALRAPPTKVEATAASLPVLQPTRLRDGQLAAALRAMHVDVGVVIAYGRILPPELLAAPRLGCVNLHASLLPRWRGAAPIQRAIAAGDMETGVCLMQMDAGLDTGPELARVVTAIGADETAEGLSLRLAELSAALLVTHLPGLLAAALPAWPQPGVGVTWAPPLQKHEGLLDLLRPAAELRDQLRAMTPWPGGQLQVGDEVWKAFFEGCALEEGRGRPGEILALDGEECLVATGDGALRLATLQRPGRRRVGAASALRGARLGVGDRLGSTPTAPSGAP